MIELTPAYVANLDNTYEILYEDIRKHIAEFNIAVNRYVKDNFNNTPRNTHKALPPNLSKQIIQNKPSQLDSTKIIKKIPILKPSRKPESINVQSIQRVKHVNNISSSTPIKSQVKPISKKLEKSSIHKTVSLEEFMKIKKPAPYKIKPSFSLVLYRLPELSFETQKCYTRKLYRQLIIKLHPDKLRSTVEEERHLFKTYYKKCKEAFKSNCLYKLWLLSKNLDLYIEENYELNQVFLLEISILTRCIDSMKTSEIYSWIHDKNDKYINAYIMANSLHKTNTR